MKNKPWPLSCWVPHFQACTRRANLLFPFLKRKELTGKELVINGENIHLAFFFFACNSWSHWQIFHSSVNTCFSFKQSIAPEALELSPNLLCGPVWYNCPSYLSWVVVITSQVHTLQLVFSHLSVCQLSLHPFVSLACRSVFDIMLSVYFCCLCFVRNIKKVIVDTDF